jgi:poly-gamma-glutamate synthesis protein (capsule biosynthesis protein)
MLQEFQDLYEKLGPIGQKMKTARMIVGQKRQTASVVGANKDKRRMISTPSLNFTEIMQQAQQGDPKAIAYWVNLSLLPLGCCAKVAQQSPDHLAMLVLCRQLPDRGQLLSILGDRLRSLSPSQSMLFVSAQLASASSVVLWQDSLSLRQPLPRPEPSFRIARLNHWLHSVGSVCSDAVEQVFPRESAAQDSVAIHPLLDQLHRPHRQRIWFGGSAVLAFLLGCGFEAVSYHATTATPSDGWRVSLPGLFGQSDDAEYIQAALETVPIVEHPATASDTVTLSFSGASWLDQATDPFIPTVQTDVALTYLDPMAIASEVSDMPDAGGQLVTDEMRSLSQDALTDSGIDIVSLPTIDLPTRSRRSQLQRILDSMDEAGLHTVGTGSQPAIARRPEILDVNGKRIAYLSYTSSGEVSELQTQITTDVQAIRPNVDWVVVNFHWQDALADYPSTHQVELAHHAVDQGTDLVVGYHPQVLQGAEIYRDRAIAYSVGNFVSNTPDDESYDTAMLKVSLREDQMRLEFLPVRVDSGQPTLALEDKAGEILTYLDHASALFNEPMRSPMILNRQVNSDAPAKTDAIDVPDTVLDESESVGSDSLFDTAHPSVEPSSMDTTAPFLSDDVVEQKSLDPERLETESFNSDSFESDDGFTTAPQPD